MLTTAKSIQLLDASGMNISPITDITSLYYEVANPSNASIISRKYVYTGFPVAVNITGEATSQIGVSINTSEKRHPEKPLYEDGQFRKIIDNDRNDDILISRVDTSIIPGTTYRQINVTNYNLSEILSYYTPLDLMDASYGELIEDISIINASINDVSNRISNLKASLDASIATLSEIINWCTYNALVPNKFYLINNYYVDGNGCMTLPDSKGFSGPTSDNPISLLVKANNTSTLDGKLYEMYDGNALKVYGTYKLEGDKIRIIYMKDKYGNEAPYDFYNLKYNDKYTFNKGNTISNYLLITDSIKNNIIKSDPYSVKKQITICSNSNTPEIYNNYIGYNSIINIDDALHNNTYFYNNIIYNDCSIYIKGCSDICQCINTIIDSSNIINLNGYDNGENSTQFLYVNSNNIININCKTNSNFVIGSSNNITLHGQINYNNVTILNNCDGSINLSDNIIVDNYINIVSDSSLNASPNSVYLFKQDVYAKSFNTLVEKTILYFTDGTITEIRNDIIT